MYINNRCGYQSITQQYLKRCLIKDEVNYIFRPNVAIIRFSSESKVVLLYRITTDTKDREHTRKYIPSITTSLQLVTPVTYPHTLTRISSYSLVFLLSTEPYKKPTSSRHRIWTNSNKRPTQDSSEQTYLSCTPQDSAHHRTPPPPVPLKNSIYQTSQMLRSHHRDIPIPIL